MKADGANSSVNVSNSLPVASSAILNSGSDINLVANVTNSILGTVTVTDNNSCEDVTNVTSYLYRTDVDYTAPNDNQNHYTSICAVNSDCINASDLDATYNCTFNVTWYADPTDAGSQYAAEDWTFYAIPYDDNASGTAANATQEMNTLSAMHLLNTSVSFGSLSLGADTGPTNELIDIQNIGNEQFDIDITGYGYTSGDGYSMNCSIGTVPLSYLQYNTIPFIYGSGGTNTTNSSVEVELNVNQGSEGTPRPQESMYFGYGLPGSGVKGSCHGVIVINAVADPNQD